MLKPFLKSLKNKNIHLVGLSGIEGSEIALFLAKHGFKNFTVHDFSPREEIKRHFKSSHSGLSPEEKEERFEQIMSLDAIYNFKDNYLKNIASADLVFVSQSWYLYESNESLKKLEKENKLINLTKLYFQLFPGKIIAVTGSNGKTTTTNIISQIFNEAKHHKKIEGNFYFTGNDRRMNQVLTDIETTTKKDWLIIEVSNRQLRLDLGRSPDIGVITNITPNHLNEYDSWNDYRNAKISLLQYQTEDDTAVLNFDDEESKKLIEHEDHNVFGFSADQELHTGAYRKGSSLIIKHGDEEGFLAHFQDLQVVGNHNISNILAASAACFIAKIPIQIISDVIKKFKGVPQRLELIREVNGRNFYNDTASTSPESVIAALNSFPSKSLLIMGGRSKDLDYKSLIDLISKKTKSLIFINSPLADHLEAELKNLPIIKVSNLKQAIDKAYEQSEKGDNIIFSPGGEYFCYFQGKMSGYKNYRTFVNRLS